MGMIASFTLISTGDYSKVVKDPRASIPTDGDRFDIDKAWHEFNEFFLTQPGPLKFAIEGKHCPFKDLDDEGIYAFVSPAVAASISKALAVLPFKKILDSVKAGYKRLNLKIPRDEEGYLKTHFATLKKAYAAAAKKKRAVLICVC